MIDSTPPLSPCELIGDFIENGNQGGDVAASVSKAVPMVMIGDFVESSANEREFKVLLHDQRTVIVFGRTLKFLPPMNSADAGTYSIVTQAGTEEVTVAYFPVKEVSGIFSGEIRLTSSI